MVRLRTRGQAASWREGTAPASPGLFRSLIFPDTIILPPPKGCERFDGGSLADAWREADKLVLKAVTGGRKERQDLMREIRETDRVITKEHQKRGEVETSRRVQLQEVHSRCLDLCRRALNSHGPEQLIEFAKLLQASYPYPTYVKALLEHGDPTSLALRVINLFDVAGVNYRGGGIRQFDLKFAECSFPLRAEERAKYRDIGRYEPSNWDVVGVLQRITGSHSVHTAGGSYANSPLFVQQASRNFALLFGDLNHAYSPNYLFISKRHGGLPVMLLPDSSGVRLIGPIIGVSNSEVYEFLKLVHEQLGVPVYAEYLTLDQKADLESKGFKDVKDFDQSSFWQTNTPELSLRISDLLDPNKVLCKQLRVFQNHCQGHGLAIKVRDISSTMHEELFGTDLWFVNHAMKGQIDSFERHMSDWGNTAFSAIVHTNFHLAGLSDSVDLEKAAIEAWAQGSVPRIGSSVHNLVEANLLSEAYFAMSRLRLGRLRDGARAFVLEDETTGKAVAFAKTWPIDSETVGLYVGVADTRIPKLSAYLYHTVAKEMAAAGFSYLNVGPSETPGLYEYRKSLTPNPIETQYYTMRFG